jgi:hypothetical protein
MPTIYLRHPVHGTKVAIAHEEAAYDASNGWVEFDPTARAAAPKIEPAPSLEVADEPILNALPARRGRARKSVEPQEE